MAFGILFLSITCPLPMLFFAHLMLSWEEKGLKGADYYAKKCIRLSLIAISLDIIVGFIVFIWAIIPGELNLFNCWERFNDFLTLLFAK